MLESGFKWNCLKSSAKLPDMTRVFIQRLHIVTMMMALQSKLYKQCLQTFCMLDMDHQVVAKFRMCK